MAELAHPDEVYVDHLPDGTILGEIPFDDPEKLMALARERMTPENYVAFCKGLVLLGLQECPEETRAIFQQML
jgi:hypothetical protein